eukprot:m.165042 g.165042  ORF g.165042 m.165042 type:complete len:471 (+) comp14417_c0_seq4:2373-3785(+)
MPDELARSSAMFQEQIEELTQKVTSLTGQLDVFKAREKEVETNPNLSPTALLARIAEYEADGEELKKQIARKMVEITTVRDECQRIHTSHEDALHQLEGMKRDNAALRAKFLQVNEALEDAEGNAQHWEQKAREVDRNATEVVNTLSTDLDQYRDRVGTLEQELQLRTAQLDEATGKLHRLQQEGGHRGRGDSYQYEQQLSQMEHEYNEEIARVKAKLKESVAVCTQWEEQAARIEEAYQGEVNELQQKLANQEREVERLQHRLSTSSKPPTTAATSLSAFDAPGTGSREIERLTARLRDKGAKVDSLQESFAALQAVMKGSGDEAKQRAAQLAEELERTKFELETVSTSLARRTSEHKEMRQRLQKLEDANQEASKTIQTLKASSTPGSPKGSDWDVSRLREELAQARSERDDWQWKFANLRAAQIAPSSPSASASASFGTPRTPSDPAVPRRQNSLRRGRERDANTFG